MVWSFARFCENIVDENDPVYKQWQDEAAKDLANAIEDFNVADNNQWIGKLPKPTIDALTISGWKWDDDECSWMACPIRPDEGPECAFTNLSLKSKPYECIWTGAATCTPAVGDGTGEPFQFKAVGAGNDFCGADLVIFELPQPGRLNELDFEQWWYDKILSETSEFNEALKNYNGLDFVDDIADCECHPGTITITYDGVNQPALGAVNKVASPPPPTTTDGTVSLYKQFTVTENLTFPDGTWVGDGKPFAFFQIEASVVPDNVFGGRGQNQVDKLWTVDPVNIRYKVEIPQGAGIGLFSVGVNSPIPDDSYFNTSNWKYSQKIDQGAGAWSVKNFANYPDTSDKFYDLEYKLVFLTDLPSNPCTQPKDECWVYKKKGGGRPTITEVNNESPLNFKVLHLDLSNAYGKQQNIPSSVWPAPAPKKTK